MNILHPWGADEYALVAVTVLLAVAVAAFVYALSTLGDVEPDDATDSDPTTDMADMLCARERLAQWRAALPDRAEAAREALAERLGPIHDIPSNPTQ